MHGRASQSASVSIALLSLIDGGDFDGAQAVLSSMEDDGSANFLLAMVELALYRDDLETADRLLDEVVPGSRSEQRRTRLLAAELRFWQEAYEETRSILDPLIDEIDEGFDDLRIAIRAKLLRARCAIRTGAYADAAALAQEPARLAQASCDRYLIASATHVRGFIAARMGRNDEALRLLANAAERFGDVGARRWHAGSRSFRAAVLSNDGRHREAIAECDEVTYIAAELGIWRDMIISEHNAARALILSERADHAIRRLETLIQEERCARFAYLELMTLYLLAFAYVLVEDVAGAARVGAEIARFADAVPCEISSFDGRLIAAWAAASSGEAEHVEALAGLVLAAEAVEDRERAIDGRVLLADRLVANRPEFALALQQAARKTDVIRDQILTETVLRRVECRLGGGQLLFGAMSSLCPVGGESGSDFDETLDGVRRYLLLNSYLAAGGNQSEAGRRIGLARSRFNHLWLQLFHDVPQLVAVVSASAAAPRARSRKKRVDREDDPAVPCEGVDRRTGL